MYDMYLICINILHPEHGEIMPFLFCASLINVIYCNSLNPVK